MNNERKTKVQIPGLNKALGAANHKLSEAGQAILERELAKIPEVSGVSEAEQSEIGRRVARAAEDRSPGRRHDPHAHLREPQGTRERGDLAIAEAEYRASVKALFAAERGAQAAADAMDRVQGVWSTLRREDEVDPDVRRRVQNDGAQAARLKAEAAGAMRERQQEMEDAAQRLADVRNRLAIAGRKRYREALRADL